MNTLKTSITKEERLPIFISGIGGTKLLGVPAIPQKPHGKADLIARATLNLLEEWN